jgi:Tol biopolymer transport system component
MFTVLIRRTAFVTLLIVGVLVVAGALIAPALPNIGQIAYSAEYEDRDALYLFDASRFLHLPLMRTLWEYSTPQWSRDGDHLIFGGTRYDRSRYDVPVEWLMGWRTHFAADAGNTLYPTDPQVGNLLSAPAWSPNGRDVAFIFELREGANTVRYLVWLQANSTANAMPLTYAFDWIALAWLDDQRLRIASVNFEGVTSQDIRVDGFAKEAQRTWDVPNISAWDPVFTPDHQRFVVPLTTPEETNFDLFEFDAAQSNPREITDLRSSNETQPAYSPDGTLLAYKLLNGDGQYVVVLPLAGGERRILYRHRTARVSDLSWSHDGQRIVFLVSLPGSHELCIAHINSNQVDCPISADSLDEPTWRPH